MDGSLVPPPWPLAGGSAAEFPDYEATVQRAVQMFRAGALQKVVLPTGATLQALTLGLGTEGGGRNLLYFFSSTCVEEGLYFK